MCVSVLRFLTCLGCVCYVCLCVRVRVVVLDLCGWMCACVLWFVCVRCLLVAFDVVVCGLCGVFLFRLCYMFVF